MDRRLFFKTLLSSSLAAPLAASLAAGSPADGWAFYLIGDSPQDTLPAMLTELRRRGRTARGAVTVEPGHPASAGVEQCLRDLGWNTAPGDRAAGLRLSFLKLRRPAAPSFTWVRNGRVIDLRREGLKGVGEGILRSERSSSLLTSAVFRSGKGPLRGTGRAGLYIDGRRRERLDLGHNLVRTYERAGGFVTVSIQDGRARVLDSSCRHKICVGSPAADAPGDRLVCAPNRFVLEVEGAGPVDTIIG
jgi:hypothetical protein